MSTIRYAGDRFCLPSGEAKPTEVYDGAICYETGNPTNIKQFLLVSGGWKPITNKLNYQTKSISYTLTTGDNVIGGDTASNSVVFTLPNAQGHQGTQFFIKRLDVNPNSCFVLPVNSQNIDGATGYYLTSQYQVIRPYSDGANWLLL